MAQAKAAEFSVAQGIKLFSIMAKAFFKIIARDCEIIFGDTNKTNTF